MQGTGSAGGRLPAYSSEIYASPDVVERCFAPPRQFSALALTTPHQPPHYRPRIIAATVLWLRDDARTVPSRSPFSSAELLPVGIA